MTAQEPGHTLEIEVAYDVDEACPVPDLTGLPGVHTADGPERRPLDAIYLDTEELLLARSGRALRRRRGGPDEGWHLKVSAPEGRHEYGWPFGEAEHDPASLTVPAEVAAGVVDDPARLRAIARVRNERSAWVLRRDDGGVVAEFTDDHVVAEDLRRGVRTVWREWELELGPSAPEGEDDRAEFFAAADRVLRAAGARTAASDSKLQRALGQ